jgi:carboxymethylenebutenolidase
MKKLLLFLLLASTAFAQDWAKAVLEKSSRHQEWITVKNGERNVQAFVVYPEIKGKAPVIIVIHENTGLTDWARTVADQLAANGYIAIAVDLLSGTVQKDGKADPNSKTSDFPDQDSARQAIGKLDADQVTGDLNAVADYAKKIKSANGKIAVAGFCWGGGQSFRFATNRQDLSAAFVFYGPPPKDFSTIKAPVYGFYGGNDNRINSTIPATQEAMKAAGKKYDPVIYEGAGHGFMRAGMTPLPADATEAQKTAFEANRKAREDAWKRWLELLKTL